jgi:hypothetical protein
MLEWDRDLRCLRPAPRRRLMTARSWAHLIVGVCFAVGALILIFAR